MIAPCEVNVDLMFAAQKSFLIVGSFMMMMAIAYKDESAVWHSYAALSLSIFTGLLRYV